MAYDQIRGEVYSKKLRPVSWLMARNEGKFVVTFYKQDYLIKEDEQTYSGQRNLLPFNCQDHNLYTSGIVIPSRVMASSPVELPSHPLWHHFPQVSCFAFTLHSFIHIISQHFCGILGAKIVHLLYLSLSYLVETKMSIFTSPDRRTLNRGICHTQIFTPLRYHNIICIIIISISCVCICLYITNPIQKYQNMLFVHFVQGLGFCTSRVFRQRVSQGVA